METNEHINMGPESAIPEALWATVEEILSDRCSKDVDSGMFYTELYTDYRDELEDKTLIKIMQSADPRASFEDLVNEAYYDYSDRVECEVLDIVLEDPRIRRLIEEGTVCQEDVIDTVRDQHYTQIPFDTFLRQDVCVDIIVDTGDGNYDFTLNQSFASWDGQHDKIIDENSALLWLCRQQGYSKSTLTNVLKRKIKPATRFMESVLQEVENCASHCNSLTFLVKMELRQLFELHDAIAKEKPINDKYFPRKSKGRGYIVLDKNTTCGLYDAWNGGGSVLEIKLDRDVKLPIHFIDSAYPDGGRGYSVDEIYSATSSLWTADAVKIFPQKKVPKNET